MSQLHPPRPPAVAGLFYPADPAELARSIRAYLAAVVPPGPLGPIKALIVPHAGYMYSAPIAAAAYRALADQGQSIRRVILLGPTHRVAVRGVAVPSVPAFTTPLGPVAVDDGARQAIADLPQVVINDAPHAQEHALEVQLPFLQTVLDDFQCLPLAVGQASTAEVAEVLERQWGGAETLIVVSSDLSHYLPYPEAQQQDRATCQRILAGHADIQHDEACGATPINGLLRVAGNHGLKPQLLDLRNSGDTAGERRQVVGYAAFVLEPGYDRP